MDTLTAIILAAGKGTRMQSTDTNKVAMQVHGKPMLLRTIEILKSAQIKNIVVVVGFAKDSVTRILPPEIIVAEQDEQLGTGHAVSCALAKLPATTKEVLIIYGDDSFLYPPETFRGLYEIHKRENAKITFITMDSKNPTGFGRIMRDENKNIIGIVEEKNASDEQKRIKEINLGCYIIDKEYLEKNIKGIKKNEVTGEYYITDIIDIISSHHGKISAYKLTNEKWKGVNTKEDLLEAEKIMQNG